MEGVRTSSTPPRVFTRQSTTNAIDMYSAGNMVGTAAAAGLGAPQRAAFEAQGFLHLPALFAPAAAAAIAREFEATMAPYANGFNRLAAPGEAHDGSAWTFISGGIEHTAAMCPPAAHCTAPSTAGSSAAPPLITSINNCPRTVYHL